MTRLVQARFVARETGVGGGPDRCVTPGLGGEGAKIFAREISGKELDCRVYIPLSTFPILLSLFSARGLPLARSRRG